MAEESGGRPDPKAVDALQQKLEQFAQDLEDDERQLFSRLIGREVLGAALLGRLSVRRLAEDDDGFWAQWAERQY
jgi:hypothetical protein